MVLINPGHRKTRVWSLFGEPSPFKCDGNDTSLIFALPCATVLSPLVRTVYIRLETYYIAPVSANRGLASGEIVCYLRRPSLRAGLRASILVTLKLIFHILESFSQLRIDVQNRRYECVLIKKRVYADMGVKLETRFLTWGYAGQGCVP